MSVKLTQKLIDKLKNSGVTTCLTSGSTLPDHVILETPCSIKWMDIQHSLSLGAFSYAVSGFYFGCRIGRYCSIGENVQIGRHAHPIHWFSSSPYFYQQYSNILDQPLPAGVDLVPVSDFSRNSPPVVAQITTIHNDVWIGHGAFILPGVTIGTGAVIGAKSVVTKDVPPYAVVVGTPAKIIRYRFDERMIEQLLKSKWWEFAPWQLKGATVDDIDSFIELINKLRISKIETFNPEKITLSEFL